MHPNLTFIDILQERAASKHDRPAFTFLPASGLEPQTVTYSELYARACGVAQMLRSEGAGGKLILLLYPPGLAFISGFYGCLCAGAVAVPATASNRLKRTANRLISIIRDARPEVGLTDSSSLPFLEALGAEYPDIKTVKWMTTDHLAGAPGAEYEPPSPAPGDLAVIQYTSGSTSSPKGVMLDHANLMHNQRVIQEATGEGEQSIMVGWLPPYHDMGLVGFILHPIYLGARCILMPTASFLQRPFRWLEAVTYYGATATAAPNFAYDLCVQKITPEESAQLDLRTLKTVINGSETIRLHTLRRFLERFAARGLRPDSICTSYGLAEATLLVSATKSRALAPLWVDSRSLDNGEAIALDADAGNARPLVGCGTAHASQEVIIVDPDTLRKCHEGRVGEIWVCGGSVGKGYWNQPERTEAVFEARHDGDDTRSYLRTGDLGFMLDRQLYVTGRLRDLIVTRGRNIYPQDIELTVEQNIPHSKPGGTVAFSVVVEGEERLVVALEISSSVKIDRRKLAADVRREIALHHDLNVHAVAFPKPFSIPKTSSGKIQRHASRIAFTEGRLGEVYITELAGEAEMAAEVSQLNDELAGLAGEERRQRLESHIRSLFSEVLGLRAEDISTTRNVLEYGLDSLRAAEFQHRLSYIIGYIPPLSLILERLTIKELTSAILDTPIPPPPHDLDDDAKARARPAVHPLSHGQRALWFIYQQEPRNAAYHIGAAIEIGAPANADALSRALGRLVERHASLRTTFEDSPTGPLQRVHRDFEIPLERHDASGRTDDELASMLTVEFHRPFSLSEKLPVRIHLFDASPVRHVLLFVAHHIVADFWSMSIAARELGQFYRAEVGGHLPPLLPPKPLDYVDYVRREEAMLTTEGERLRQYWVQQLRDAPALDLPLERPKLLKSGGAGARHTVCLDAALTKSLEQLALAHETTLFVVLLSAFHILLHRYGQQTDVTVGTPLAGRSDPAFREVVGYFVNPLALRSRMAADTSYEDFLDQLRRTFLDALDHGAYPFPLLVQSLQPERDDANHPPVFQAMFVWQAAPATNIEKFTALALGLPGVRTHWEGWPVGSVPYERTAAQFDLTLSMAKHDDDIIGSIEYRTGSFSDGAIERLRGHFVNILQAVVADSFVRISRLPMLTGAERKQLQAWNETFAEYREGHTLQHLFEAQAERTPGAPALFFRDRVMSFAELNRLSGQLAVYLRSRGVSAEVLVGVLLEPGVEMVVGILGILKAGGAYVPFNPEDPQERLNYLLQDARPCVLITVSKFADRLRMSEMEVIALDEDWPRPGTGDASAGASTVAAPDTLAYVMYTSGSTGGPKAVMITHHAVCNRLLWMRDEHPLTTADRVLQKTPYTFDVSVWEIFLPLITGAGMIITEPGGHRDPTYMAGLIRQQQVTMVHFVPSMLHVFLEEPAVGDCTSLRRVICSGETLTPRLQDLFFESSDAELYNLYGPTEAAIDITSWTCRRGETGDTVPIGRPISNCRVYVLDQYLNQVPVGHPGELYLGGVGLSRGYRGRPDLTAAAFVPDPFSPEGSARLYTTGDVVRFRPDGNLEFLGRTDYQVKVRGFRVELGEVEAVLNEHPAVRECVVVMAERDGQQARMAAFVVPCDGETTTVAALREFMSRRLSASFIPALFRFLPALPLTPNGKIDRRALRRLALSGRALETEPVEPQTADERLLVEIWRDVLGVDVVGVLDNFFALGGDSIRSLQVKARARKLGRDFAVTDLFKFQTVRQLAAVLQDVGGAADDQSSERFGLVDEEVRRALSGRVEDAFPLARLQEALVFQSRYADDYEAYVISIHVRAQFDEDAFNKALTNLVGRHEMLRISYNLTDYDEYLQLVHSEGDVRAQVHDLRGYEHERQEKVLDDLVEEERFRRFDWEAAPLLRLQLHRRSESSFQVTLTHPLYDGWSVAMMLVELFTDYMQSLQGSPAHINAPVASYKEFVAAERRAVRSPEVRDFWRDKLLQGGACLLPRHFSAGQTSDSRRRRMHIHIPDETADALRNLALSQKVPLKSVLLAAHLRVVGILTGRDTVVTGLITNGRLETPDGDRVVGMFLNTVPLVMKVADCSWVDLIKRALQAEQETWVYRHFPFSEIRSMFGTAPLDIAFNFINFHVYDHLRGLDRFEVLDWKNPSDQTYFPLCAYFNVDPVSSSLLFFLDNDPRHIPASQVENIAAYYLNAFAAMTESPDGGVESRPLIGQQELQRQLAEWNDTATRDSTDVFEPIYRIFEARAAETPESIAAVFVNETLTYRELNRRANRMARHLREIGIVEETPVAVLTGRTSEMLVALLAVLKAGGAYVPLHTDFPAQRLNTIISEAQARVVIVGSGLNHQLILRDADILCMEDCERIIPRYPDANPATASNKDALAYIIFTSGSTGAPKGVEVTHGSLTNVLRAFATEFSIGRSDTLLSVTALTFDISTLELFLPLMTGARLVLAGEGASRDYEELRNLLETSQPTLMQATPSMWRLLLEANWKGSDRLRILCGGEPLPRDLADGLLLRCREVWNLYGPTETTIWSAACRVVAGDETPPIGRPLPNTTFYVLDAHINPLPPGAAGELYIGGAGVARGYRHRPSLTAERFIPNPFAGESGGRLYRTGDQVRYREDGTLEFMGRLDSQIKIRGVRIELGEIEALLIRHPDVRDAVVAARDMGSSDRRLIAYVTSAGRRMPDGAQLRELLSLHLPSYMIPSAFVVLERLPLTVSGKIDRNALPPPPGADAPAQSDAGATHLSDMQRHIADIWRDVLDVHEVQPDTNFFDIGGHSLLLMRVHTRLLSRLGVEVSVIDLFRYPTVRLLADYLEHLGAGIKPSDEGQHRGKLRKKSSAKHRRAAEQRSRTGEAEREILPDR